MEFLIVAALFVVAVVLLVVWMRASDARSSRRHDCHDALMTYIFLDTLADILKSWDDS